MRAECQVDMDMASPPAEVLALPDTLTPLGGGGGGAFCTQISLDSADKERGSH